MGKWVAGILGSIIVGVVIWALTTIVPDYFKEKKQASVDEPVLVSCTPNPPTVAAGEVTELAIAVTKGGKPIADAHVMQGLDDWGTTASDGTERIQWHAPPGAQGGTRIRVSASPTARDGGGGGEGDCQIMFKS